MTDFKGFDDWIAIFKGGKQTDSRGRGREHDGDELIKQALNTFDPEYYKPPLVVGHPKHNSPAFGVVKALKKVGNTLYAKCGNVVPAFEALVRKGLYKKRSASFYPDGRLNHVGFLGSMAPAVKGLADIKFKERGDTMTFNFNQGLDPGEELNQKIQEVLKSPPGFDKYGRKIEGDFTFRDAFNYVVQENPELARAYIESITPAREQLIS